MKVKVRFIGKWEKEVEFEGKTLKDLLTHLKLNTEAILARKKGKLCLLEEQLKEGEEIELMSAISGG